MKKKIRKIFFWMKNGQKRDFLSKKSQKCRKKELSWHREMVDSSKNQKNLHEMIGKKYVGWKKDWPKMAENVIFIPKMAFLSKHKINQ